jgi:hypothetical protein
MKFLHFFAHLFFFLMLTVLSQVGGLIYFLHLFMWRVLAKKLQAGWPKRLLKWSSFVLFYLICCLVFLPFLARLNGRVPLPIGKNGPLRPLTFGTVLLNRHYVKPASKTAVINAATKLQAQFSGTQVNYLDANFPFWDEFPLLPHLSHDDGEKLDLAFLYINAKTGLPSTKVPSPIGYGACEGPLPHENNMPETCRKRGFWQYNLLPKLVSQDLKKGYVFDPIRTKALVQILVQDPQVRKIFIEPHLKSRLGLGSDKVRFHGCQAVRHDDHLHVEL